MNYNDVLTFWFDELTPAQWWLKDTRLDALIKEKFSVLHQQANKGELFKWRDNAKGRLAEIIVLDQFSRNIFRDSSHAFASDSMALTLAQEAVSIGIPHQLNAIERSFLYMPYMHSESLPIHDVALSLYEDNGIQSNLDFEIMHRNIIMEFGRYPHRNLLLGRTSSAEEIEFLKLPDSSF